MRFVRPLITFTLLFSIFAGWMFSGWPQAWEGPPFPPKVSYTSASHCSSSPCTITSTETFTVPAGVTSLTITMWGGGGAGGTGSVSQTQRGGGGGGGGAYTACTVAVTPLTGYTVTVGAQVTTAGANGNDSSFPGNDGTCTASGGSGGSTTNHNGGSGGGAQTVGGVVTAAQAGGGGGAGQNQNGGGGGGGGEAAGTTATGNNGTDGSGGSGGAGGTGRDGADGGPGGNNGAGGSAGTVPGGGGGGPGGSSDAGGAGVRGEVVISWSATILSVVVIDGTVAYGTVALSGQADTTGGDTQDAVNDGNTTEDFNIKGNNASGGGCTWTLAATSGSDQYVHEYSTNSGTDWVALSTSYQPLATGIAQNATQSFDLRITIPTDSSCGGQQNVNVDVQAVQG